MHFGQPPVEDGTLQGGLESRSTCAQDAGRYIWTQMILLDAMSGGYVVMFQVLTYKNYCLCYLGLYADVQYCFCHKVRKKLWVPSILM